MSAASSNFMFSSSAGIFEVGCTVTVAVAELFAGFMSVCGNAETVAVLLSIPAAVGLTLRTIVADAPLLSEPRLQVTVVVPLQLPCDGVAETNVALAGMTSVTTTDVAVFGPLFVTAML